MHIHFLIIILKDLSSWIYHVYYDLSKDTTNVLQVGLKQRLIINAYLLVLEFYL